MSRVRARRQAPGPSRFAATFRRWVEANAHQMKHPPYRWRVQTGGAYEFRFRGATNRLLGVVGPHYVNVFVVEQGDVWDHVCINELKPVRTASGRWACEWCERKHRGHYASLDRLLNKHLYQPLLDWMNRNLVPGNQLMLLRYGVGCTAIEIRDGADGVPRGATAHAAVPAIARQFGHQAFRWRRGARFDSDVTTD